MLTCGAWGSETAELVGLCDNCRNKDDCTGG